MAKMSIIFNGFADLAAEIDRSGGDLHKAVDDALTQTQKQIQQNVTTAAAPYATKGLKGYAKGEMYKSIIKDAEISWHGSVAEVKVGFDLNAPGGWHSIFVMYGTPRMSKDPKIYNAIKGAKTKKEIAEIQEKIMKKYVTIGE